MNSPSTRQEGPAITARVRLLPIIFFMAYLNLTVFLFAFGPWDYPIQETSKLYIFLFFAHFSLLVGYLSGAFRKPRVYDGRWKTERLVLLSVIVTLVLLFPTSAFRTGNWLPDIGRGIDDPGGAYALSEDLRDNGNPF